MGSLYILQMAETRTINGQQAILATYILKKDDGRYYALNFEQQLTDDEMAVIEAGVEEGVLVLKYIQES